MPKTNYPPILSAHGQGVAILASCLPLSIAELDISNNPAVGEKGGLAIARILSDSVRSANLRRLDVSNCNLGDKGLACLAEGLESAKGLECLSIAGNLNGPGSVGAAGGTGEGKMALGELSVFFLMVIYSSVRNVWKSGPHIVQERFQITVRTCLEKWSE